MYLCQEQCEWCSFESNNGKATTKLSRRRESTKERDRQKRRKKGSFLSLIHFKVSSVLLWNHIKKREHKSHISKTQKNVQSWKLFSENSFQNDQKLFMCRQVKGFPFADCSWQGGSNWGQGEWLIRLSDKSYFPNPAGKVDSCHAHYC